MSSACLVVPTLFEPPSMAMLISSAQAQDIPTLLVRDEFTNTAWNLGIATLREKGFDYAIVVNDDVNLRPHKRWIQQVLAHHEAGHTHVLVTLDRGRPGDPLARGMKRCATNMRSPMGHCFSVDLSVPVPEIPDDMLVMHGDYWIKLWHDHLGSSCTALDTYCITGPELRLGMQKSYTVTNPDFEEKMGRTMEDILIDDHLASGQWFEFPTNFTPPNEKAARVGWRGLPLGLSEKALALEVAP